MLPLATHPTAATTIENTVATTVELCYSNSHGKNIIGNSGNSKELTIKDRRANPRERILSPKYQRILRNQIGNIGIPLHYFGYRFANSATSASIAVNDLKAKHNENLTWLTALHEWNAQKDLTRSFVSLLLFLCNPRWLAWLCVTNQSKGTSIVCQNGILSAQFLNSIQSW